MLKEFWNALTGNSGLAGGDALDLLVVLLGNPGPEHRAARHNLGFMVGEQLFGEVAGAKTIQKYRGHFWAGEIDGVRTALLFPQTFMNDSGRSVTKALEALDVGTEHLVVVHDDIDLAFGRIRVRGGGTTGGHLGVQSIADLVGTRDFRRVKLGVGRPPGWMDPADFVLAEFESHELPTVGKMVELAARAVLDLAREPFETVMSRYNGEAG
ncbi:MAG: aminoacyl-tRNA hydrolase [Chloroflexota bacterium]|nr:aminoacyl-tRNA hydrolase [Chloroflexota bacterium]MDP6757787.1 aminoacyl-tRNA hydrolase [Chloroflexota bacterium]